LTAGISGRSEEPFRLLVQSIEDYAIFMLDPSGNVASWNAGARVIKGYGAEDVIGRHFSMFYTPEDQAAGKPESLVEAATKHGRVEEEGWRVRKDGSRFWADVVLTALRDDAGKLVGFAKVTRDLTSRRAMEERLREAEDRLATTLKSIGDGVLAADRDANVTMINPVAQQLTGWTEAAAIGRNIDEVFDIVNETTRARVENPVHRVLTEGRIVGLANHTVLIARDGTERPIADSGAPIRDDRGLTHGAVLVFRDVTEERRAEEALRLSEERLSLMIASVSDYAIFMLDPTGYVVSWNPGAERIKGYAADEIIGQHFSRFFTPEDVDEEKPGQELEIAAREGRFEAEAWRVRKNGSRFWANIVVSAMRGPSGELIGFTKVTRDLTARRRMEEERVKHAQAEEALRLRDEFLSIASHELKTPLTALQLQLDGIINQGDAVDPKLAGKIERAARAGERLGDLIESLLDVSRIATGKLRLQLETFNLVESARELVERMSEAARDARCDVSLDARQPVVGTWDRLRVEQILTNLLGNAFRHAGGGPVVVRVGEEGRDAILEVRDRGPGLPGDPLRLFGRFERASGNGYGGLGLGLYLAREFAEAHEGSITATTVPSGGASFVVRLPRQL
jgi:PAS domain S-box-containing protein